MNLLFRLSIGLALLGICLAASVLQMRATSEADKTIILNSHNSFRKGVSPPATDMRKMYWDNDLERVAQTWVDQCIAGHDNGYERRQNANIGAQVGQNYAQTFSWSDAIKMWHDEVKFYNYDTGSSNVSGEAIGHYTQVVWSESSLVGCAMANCGTNKHYICNYAYGNLNGQKIYQNGTSCAACQSKCVEDKLCDCPNGKICKNGGVMNLNDCSCTCQSGFSGDSCEICPWEDFNSNCGSFFTENKCAEWANVPAACPVMCGFCPDTCPGKTIKSCQNGGQLQQDCTCLCHPNYTGDLCQTVSSCSDASYCGTPQPYGFPVSFCSYDMVIEACPKMCGKC